MEFNFILTNIKKHITLSSVEEQIFCDILRPMQVAKNEPILQNGKICDTIYFVVSGTLSAYYRTEEGKESTIMFAVKDWWITDMNSFTNKQNAMLDIEAIEKSTLLAIRFEDLEFLYKKVPAFETYFRTLFQKAYIREQLRALDTLTYTTKERYSRFVEKYPQIVRKVSQKRIASYLGVTPEFLSSVKK